MCCYKIWVDIIIPIICALIGGCLTIVGVSLTIWHENNKDKKNQKLLYTPYLIKSNESTKNKIFLKQSIKHDLIIDQTEYYFCYIIEKLTIQNSSNAECILTGFIMDGVEYEFTDNFLLKNSLIEIDFTGNSYINKIKPIESMYLIASDVLGNKYFYKCDFKQKSEGHIIQIVKDKEYTRFQYKYKITNIELPREKIDKNSG